MTDYLTAIEDIKTVVAGAVPGVAIVQSHAEGVALSSGVPQSYVVMTFGGPIKYGRDKGIAESSRNPNLMWVSIQCVAAMSTVANRIKQDIFNALEDYRPSDCGRMTPEGGFATDTSDDSTKPVRYVSTVRFSFIQGLSSP